MQRTSATYAAGPGAYVPLLLQLDLYYAMNISEVCSRPRSDMCPSSYQMKNYKLLCPRESHTII